MELVPLISGAEAGPLGIVHLPRLWLKLRAHATGMLPDGYRHANGGTDDVLLARFGIDGAAFIAYLAVEAPDYQACEAWIAAHATDLSAPTIAAFNAETLAELMPEPRRSEWRARFGLDADADLRAIILNQLDDWDGVHAQLVATGAGAAAVPLIPAISTSSAGPLGVLHLPRLWLKHLLFSVGRLQDGYRHGAGGFDEVLATAIGLDAEAFGAYIAAEKPTYLVAEAWVRDHAADVSTATVAALAARLRSALMPEAMAATRRAELGIDDPAMAFGIVLNDLDDWAGLHRLIRTNAP